MLIGVPKEIKNNEYRIGLTPAGVRELVGEGHQVIVQRDGALAIGFENEHYEQAGAEIVDTPQVFVASIATRTVAVELIKDAAVTGQVHLASMGSGIDR